MTERPIDALIDHAASLQRQIDQLSREVQIVATAALMLAVALTLLAWRLSEEES